MEQEIYSLTEKIKATKDVVLTEEATKNAFVMPFLKALGYDVFDPQVIIPEFTADIGTKKGEKVDYAIMNNGSPLVLIEVKGHTESLDNHNNQLIRYFHSCSSAKFAILTNGIEYRFFSDIDSPNMMDKTPFFVINLEKLKPKDIKELERFAHAALNTDEILKMASIKRYHQQIHNIFKEQVENPSDDFVRLFATQIIDGSRRVTANILEEFRGHVKRAFSDIISDLASEKIIAIKNNITNTQDELNAQEEEEKENLIVTTEEELQAFYIVRSLFAHREDVKLCDIGYKDTRIYFNVIYENKVTRWICRFYFNGTNKFFTLPLENGKDQRIDISSIDELYKYRQELNESLSRRIKS